MAGHGTHILETDRLVLRPLSLADAEAMYANWASDSEVAAHLSWAAHESVHETQALLMEWVACYDDPTFYQWGMVLSDTQMLIGTISVVRQDISKQHVEIGYCLGKAWWNQGLATEALRAVKDYFFTHEGKHKIIARHDVNNPASGAVMQKVGMQFVGVQMVQEHADTPPIEAAYYTLKRPEKP